MDGEALAQKKIVALPQLFEGILSQRLRSRLSPLGPSRKG